MLARMIAKELGAAEITWKPRIEKSILYLDNTPGFGIEFNPKALQQYGTKVL